MKNHLKRIAAPRTWILARKETKFTLRPNSGSHSLEMGLPLGTLFRDHFKLVATMAEAQKALNNNEVLVDGKRRKDRREIVGLFDVISIPSIKRAFRVVLDAKGRLVTEEIDVKNATTKVCKVVGKTTIRGGKNQLNLYDGKNILTDKKEIKVGDSIVITLPKFEIKKVLPLKKGCNVFLTKGKHAGTSGVLDKMEGEHVQYTLADKTPVETTKGYLFVME